MPTRLAAETPLFDRWGGLLYFVYAKGSTTTDRPVLPTGTTAIYNDAIGFAMTALGLPPADPSAITDADLSRVPVGRWFVFLDLAEYRLIRSIVGNFVDTTESGTDLSQDWAKLADRAQARAEDLEKQLAGYLQPYIVAAGSGPICHVPATAHPPVWRPGMGRWPGYGPGFGRGPWRGY